MNTPHKFPFSARSASFLEHPSPLSGCPAASAVSDVQWGEQEQERV